MEVKDAIEMAVVVEAEIMENVEIVMAVTDVMEGEMKGKIDNFIFILIFSF